MKRLLITAAAVVSLGVAAVPAPANAATSIGVAINVGDPYRGAALRFRSEPEVVLVPSTRVYYVDDYDYDLYRYGSSWYFVEDGRWYRARSYRGPFTHIRVASVPRSIVTVPVKYRRHWGPPAHAKAYGYHKKNSGAVHVVERGSYRDNDRGGKNKSKGKGKH
jgi:hypothetical protein